MPSSLVEKVNLKTKMKTKLLTLLFLTLAAVALVARPVAAADIDLAWDPNPAPQAVTRYTVYERTPASVKLFDTTNTVATIVNASPGTHTYVVTAWNVHGESAPSVPVTTELPALLSAPLNLRATIRATITVTVP